MKKVISYILSISMILSIFVPTALANTAGEKYIDVDLSKYESIANGHYEHEKIVLGEKSSATIQVYVPFRAEKITFKYSGSSKVKIYLNDRLIETNFSSLSTNVSLNPNILGGQYQMIIVAEKPLEINKISFFRKSMHSGGLQTNYNVMPNFTLFQKEVQQAIIASSTSPVLMVNGAKRYVDANDTNVLPYIDEMGQIYLPLHSFARAFEYYYEERENEWVITKDQLTFHYKNGVLTKQDYAATPVEISNVTKLINGTTYMPLKYFAEFEGKSVVKKDNIYVVDYIANVNDILDADTYPELKANYDSWSVKVNNGKTYYVSQAAGASDSNPGTYDKPFKTIKKAADIAKAGDTVIIRGGVYYETLAPKNNGTAASPIIFKAAEGETVQLSNLQELGAPIGTEGDMLIYEAVTDLGYGKNQLFYDGNKHLVPGRYPNENTNPNAQEMPEGLDPVWTHQMGNMSPHLEDSKLVVSDTDLNQPKDYWVGATVAAMEGYGWTLGTGIVDESDYGWVHIGKSGRWWYDPSDLITDYAYITNHKNTIDLPGEWAFDDGKFYILPPEGTTAETLKLSQKVSHVSFDLADSKFIVIDGINSIAGGAKMNNSEMCVFRNGKYEYISHYTYSHDQRDGYIDDRNKYNKDGPPQKGEQGFYIGGQDNIFVNNEFLFSAAAALFITGRYTYVENNYISDTGYGGSYVGGIYVSNKPDGDRTDLRGGSSIFSNTLARVGRHSLGISISEDYFSRDAINSGVGAVIPEVIAYNDVYDGSLLARDTAPWYQYGVAAGTERMKSRHYSNLVWNSWAAEGSLNSLMYYDGMTSMFQAYNNVMFWTNNLTYGAKLYKQNLSTAVGIVDSWDNSVLDYVEGGKDAIKAEQYPSGKIFKSGYSKFVKDQTPYLNNMDKDLGFISVDEGKASEGSKIENGLYVPSENGARITFSNVDFGNGANAIRLYFTGNPCQTGDKVTVSVGDSAENPITKKETVITAVAPNEYVVDVTTVIFDKITGKKNVYITFDEVKSAKLSMIMVEKSTKAEDRIVKAVFADSGEVMKGNPVLHEYAPEGFDGHKYYKHLQDDASLLYKNVKIDKDVNELFLGYGTTGSYRDQKIELYLDSPQGEKIAEAVSVSTRNSEFNTYMTIVPLLKALPAGNYNIYIRFVDELGYDGESKKTGNFMRFAFGMNDEYDIPMLEVEADK